MQHHFFAYHKSQGYNKVDDSLTILEVILQCLPWIYLVFKRYGARIFY